MTDRRVCDVDGCNDTAEWEEAIVWRHDREMTKGSRVRESERVLDQPRRRCQAHMELARLGIHQDQQSLL